MTQRCTTYTHSHATFMLVILGLLAFITNTAQGGQTPKGAFVLNLNTATSEQLQRLPGIGKKRAADIVKQRALRPYRRVSDILRIRGIGRRTYMKLRSYLTVAPKGAIEQLTKVQIAP